MKIKIYELLGLIKDGKAPKKIKYEYLIYELTPERNDYYCKQAMRWFTNEINALGVLDNEVEILEEVEDKEYEDIEEKKMSDYYKCDDYQLIRDNFEIVNNQINALIRNQKIYFRKVG